MTSTPSANPDFSTDGACPAFKPFLDAAKDRRFDELSQLIAAVADPDDLSYVAASVSTPEFRDYLTGLGTSATGRQLAILAGIHTRAAWQTRSGMRAQYVEAHQWKGFRHGLVMSERLLFKLVAEQPGNALAWENRLLNARGLELGQAEARRRYDEVARIVPHPVRAQSYLLLQKLPKWGGTVESAHEFVRECVGASPAGSINGVIVASFYLERWLDEGGDAAVLRAPGVGDELMSAARHSVLHAAFGRPYEWVPALSGFACAFSLAGDYPAAAPFFRAMGGFGSRSAWSYLPGDPAQNFVKHRDLALSKG